MADSGERMAWRSRRRIVAAVTVVAVMVPASMTFASHIFSDVSTSNSIHDHVSAIAAAGITSGCGGGKYCPGNAVTRGQMAVFLNKLGALSSDQFPVVNAFMLNAEIPVNFHETFTLDGGAASECETVNLADLFEFWFGVEGAEFPFESYTMFQQLIAAPIATDLVNVQLVDDPGEATPDNVIDVCFRTVDGTNLTAGDYETYYQWTIYFGGNVFDAGTGTGTQGTSSVGERLVPQPKDK